jgi:hypothetical protein
VDVSGQFNEVSLLVQVAVYVNPNDIELSPVLERLIPLLTSAMRCAISSGHGERLKSL